MPTLSPKDVAEIARSKASYLEKNEEILDIFENNLTKYIEQDLYNQLSEQSFAQVRHRISPINILPKVIDKLTNIYQTSITRKVEDGTDSDADILNYYQSIMSPNESLNQANELYNLLGATLIYPSVKKGLPYLRIIENDRFIPHASNSLEPTEPTEIILNGEKVDNVQTFWVWNANEFYITDANEKMRPDLMAAVGNFDGVNPIGRLPFIYVNESKRKILPKQDLDMLKIVKLIPVMLSDLNLAAMYQSFSILYGIDIDDQNIKLGPNAFLKFKSDPTSDKTPSIGTIKPEVDYTQVLGLIEAQISMWLGTKGIKSSSIGSLTQDNFSSGISKIIDEMDTFEARQKQVTVFMAAEKELWDLVLNYMHPYWVATGVIPMNAMFTRTAEVVTKFSVQLPLQSRGQVVRDVKEEYMAGFTSRARALARLNPELTEQQIEDLINEIDEERDAPTESEDRDPGAPEAEPEERAS